MIESLLILIAGLVVALVWIIYVVLRTIKQIATDLEEINKTMWDIHDVWWQNR